LGRKLSKFRDNVLKSYRQKCYGRNTVSGATKLRKHHTANRTVKIDKLAEGARGGAAIRLLIYSSCKSMLNSKNY
jgi:hypothetical protein